MTSVYKISIPESKAEVWAKIESENPTGTHKDRSMGPWIEYYIKQGQEKFVVSSSGNSAAAAAKVCAEKNVKLTIFMHPDDKSHRLEDIKDVGDISVKLSKTPKRDAFQFSEKHNIPNLRASTDDNALEGYKEIAFEIIEQIPKINNIFIPTSSGATLEGIFLGFEEKSKKSPSLYAVQTTKVHPIAGDFDNDFKNENKSYASAIVDNIAHRKDMLVEIIKETKGSGLVISNASLMKARNELRKDQNIYDKLFTAVGGVEPSRWQSALAFAGFLKWQAQHPNKAKNEVSVCLFTD